MANQQASCCNDPPDPKFDEKSTKAMVKFAVVFVVVVLSIIVVLYLLKDWGPVRHLNMSPRQMREQVK